MVKERRSLLLLVGAVVMLLCCIGCIEPGVHDGVELTIRVSGETSVVRGYVECYVADNLDEDPETLELSYDGEASLWSGVIELDEGETYRIITVMEGADSRSISYSSDDLELTGPDLLEVVTKPGYVIGEDVAGTGYIFYEQGNREYAKTGWRYLCCAPNDWNGTGCDPTAPWRYGNMETGLTSAGIGDGEGNCQALDAYLTDPESAAGICSGCEYGNCSDWFLPSIGELQLLYDGLYQNGGSTVSLCEGYYWSSTEDGLEHALCLGFNVDGQQDSGPKLLDGVIRIRPVRHL